MSESSGTPSTSSPAKSGRKRLAWRVLQWVFIAAALSYFVVKLSGNWEEYRATAAGLRPQWLLVGAASLIVLATYAALIQSWRVLIAGAGSALSFPQAVRIWTIANLGRYIPGKVASIAALGVLAAQQGVSGTAAASAAILGTLINIGAGFGIVALTGSQVLDTISEWARIIAFTGSAVFIAGVAALPWILPPAARFLATRLKKQSLDIRVSNSSLWTSVTINIISWFCYGWAFMVFSQAVLPAVEGTLAQFVAVWAASYLVGYLAFFAPGGIGAREFAMVGGLTVLGMTDAAGAGVIAVSSRLWLSVLELLPGLVALIVTPVTRKAAR